MIALILFLLVGALLLASLFFFTRRPATPAAAEQATKEAADDAERALDMLQLGLLLPDALGRILARQDLDYVTAKAPEVRRLFLRERQRLVLSWVSQVHQQVASLRRFYLGTARYYARLQLAVELRLAMDFAALALACRALQVLVFLRGPYAAPRVVAATVAAASRVCGVSEISLDLLRPLRPMAGDSAVV